MVQNYPPFFKAGFQVFCTMLYYRVISNKKCSCYYGLKELYMTEVTKDWIDLDELAGILRCNKETLRRKCVSGEIVSRYEKVGKYKKYQINLNSLSVKDREKYESQAFRRDEKIKNACQNSLYYKNAPEWAKNQADKYLEIINLTKI